MPSRRAVDPRRWALFAGAALVSPGVAGCGDGGLFDPGRDYCGGDDYDWDPSSYGDPPGPCEPGPCEGGGLCLDGECTVVPSIPECEVPIGLVPEGLLGFDGQALWALDGDGDGIDELVVDTGHGVELRGFEQQDIGLPLPPSTLIRSIASADLDGNGSLDLAVLYEDLDGVWLVALLGDGALTYASGPSIALAPTAVSVAGIDLDGASGLEVAVARTDGEVELWALEADAWGLALQLEGLPGAMGVQRLMTGAGLEDQLVLRSATSTRIGFPSAWEDSTPYAARGDGDGDGDGEATGDSTGSTAIDGVAGSSEAAVSTFWQGPRTLIQLVEVDVASPSEVVITETLLGVGGTRPGVVSIDLDGLGRRDVVLGHTDDAQAIILRSVLGEPCHTKLDYEVQAPLVAGDFDGDGREELASSGWGGAVRVHGWDP